MSTIEKDLFLLISNYSLRINLLINLWFIICSFDSFLKASLFTNLSFIEIPNSQDEDGDTLGMLLLQKFIHRISIKSKFMSDWSTYLLKVIEEELLIIFYLVELTSELRALHTSASIGWCCIKNQWISFFEEKGMFVCGSAWIQYESISKTGTPL